MEISIRAYARRKGVSDAAVRKAITDGRIRLTKNGKINPQTADKQWVENSDPAQIKLNTSSRKNKPNLDADDENSSPVNSFGVSYQQSRAIKEAYEARLKKLEYDEKSGKLISIELVQKESFNAARKTRDMLLNIPDKVIPLMIGKNDLHEMKEILRKEILRSLEGLANIFDDGEK